MKLRAFGALVCALTLSACTASMNEADYTRIGYGPSFDMAYARCDQRASGVGTGYLAIGSPAFVAGAALGNAIDNAVAQDRYRRNCLAMYGWKRGPRGKGTTAAAAKPGRSQPDRQIACPDA